MRPDRARRRRGRSAAPTSRRAPRGAAPRPPAQTGAPPGLRSPHARQRLLQPLSLVRRDRRPLSPPSRDPSSRPRLDRYAARCVNLHLRSPHSGPGARSAPEDTGNQPRALSEISRGEALGCVSTPAYHFRLNSMVRLKPDPTIERTVSKRTAVCLSAGSMKDRRHGILVSHVGTLPRPEALEALSPRYEFPRDDAAFRSAVPPLVRDVARRQARLGIDIVNDGEFAKRGNFSYYAQTRLS